jgi:hypothetical protein
MLTASFRLLAGLGVCLLFCGTAAHAQSKKVNPAAIRMLDMEADRLQKEFVDSLVTLADGYEEAGDIERAQETLSRVLELDPQRDKVQQRMETMKNLVFESNEVELEVDVARGWVATGLKVTKGDAVRISATGSYKLILNANLTADGVSTDDINRDMSGSANLGELMGVVFPPPKGRQKSKPGKPFAIGSETEFSPNETGMLFLRVNIPNGTKSIGSLRVTLRGNIERGG